MSNKDFKSFLKLYDYFVPPELIAKKPASPRDSARLLVYKRKSGKIFFDTFANLTEYLPENAVLVFNDTKVLPARLLVKKGSGGLAKILYLGAERVFFKFLSDRNLPAGSKVFLNKKIFFEVLGKEGKYHFLKPSFDAEKIFEVLEKYGLTPIPLYIKNSPLSEKELRKEYQTVFASQKGSVAAPTASLHFTRKLLNKIKKSGRKIVFVTLHVNLGTFSPLEEKNLRELKLHEEYYEISKESAEILNRAKKFNQPIIPVGTTAMRALESVGSINRTKRGFVAEAKKLDSKKLKGKTDIFIREGYKFNFADGLITNFHVPKSSLLMLVAAMTGRKKLLKLYQKAIEKKLRFFSFGDGMLIL